MYTVITDWHNASTLRLQEPMQKLLGPYPPYSFLGCMEIQYNLQLFVKKSSWIFKVEAIARVAKKISILRSIINSGNKAL